MTAADSGGIAFLPFLKKKPLAAARKQDDEDENPLALPLPPAPKHLSTGAKKATQFVSKLNRAAKPAATAKAAGPTKAAAGKAAAGPGRPLTAAGASPGKSAKASPGQPLTAAAAAAKAKADADAKRLRQLERMAKLGALATADAPPELRKKVEQAKQEAQAMVQKQQEEARRREALERQRQQREAELQKRRQLQEALQQRLQAEKQRAYEAKLKALHGPGYVPPQRSAAASSGQHRQAAPRQLSADSSVDQFRMSDEQQRPRQQQQQQQQPKSTYAHFNPRQRAFLEARQRERQARGAGGRSAYAAAHPGRGRYEEGYASEDSLDDFIDDGDEEDWRSHLREVTRYDPSKFKDFGDDRSMEASAAEIAKEEARSKRIAKTEDEREAEAEAQRLAAKEAKRRKKSSGAGTLFDD